MTQETERERMARPSLNLDVLVFWLCFIGVTFTIGVMVGYAAGEKDGMAKATPICKITCEPKEEVK
jgi:hypothetical protein